MLVQTTYTQGTTKEHYDKLLSEGWFRGTGVIYKSDIVCMEENLLSTVHIRLALKDFVFKKRHLKLLSKNNGVFRYTVGPPSIDDKKEKLYLQHLDRFRSFVHNSLADLINTGLEDITFETNEICVYLNDNLVALSYFDTSDKSMASILCVYDQEYNSFSLGIYTMLLEIQLAQSKGIQFYYPGYVMDLPSCFDYKLSLGEMEWLDAKGNWIKENTEIYADAKAAIIRTSIDQLQNALMNKNIEYCIRIYPYFTVGYVLRSHPDLLRFPAYLNLGIDHRETGISFDIESGSFVLFLMSVAEDFSNNPSLMQSKDYREGALYEMRLMRCDAIWKYGTLEAMLEALDFIIAGNLPEINESEIYI